jgi:hypothetical protein
VLALAVACSSPDPCADPPPDDAGCPDLTFSGDLYDEWRPVEGAVVIKEIEELGDANYPACNDREPCNGPDLGGFGATDVWRLDGVDPDLALMSYRQGTRSPVIFVLRGTDPDSVPGLSATSTG